MSTHNVQRTDAVRSISNASLRFCPNDVATNIPDFVRREVNALKSEGCEAVNVEHFDRRSAIWSITFERDNKRSARLLWCIEVDA